MQTKQGIVISDSTDKTVVVRVDRAVRHPLYKKNYRISKKFHAHDAENKAKVGDVVEITESKPLSKLKRWNVAKIIAKDAKVIDQPAAVESEQEKELREVSGREKEVPKQSPVASSQLPDQGTGSRDQEAGEKKKTENKVEETEKAEKLEKGPKS